jgi:hypothetical protein
MQEIQSQVLSVTGRQAGNKIIYDVAMADGVKYAAWEPELAGQANALVGQAISARVETTQNSKNGKTYTNHTLHEIAVVGGLPALAQPLTPGAPIPVPGVPVPGAAAIPMQAQKPEVDWDEKDRRIARQNVLRTSFEFIGTLYNGAGPESFEAAEAKAFELASKLYAKVYAVTAPASTPVPVPETAAAVAAQVPGVQVGTEGVAAEAGQASSTDTAPTPEW